MVQSELARKQDRRRFTRIPVRQLRSSVLSPWVGFTDVWVVDLSLGGAFLRTPKPLPVGETMCLELPRSHDEPLRLPTRVVSSREVGRTGIGVCFDELDPASLAELRELLLTLAPPGVALEVAASEPLERTRVAPRPSAPVVPLAQVLARAEDSERTAVTPIPSAPLAPSLEWDPSVARESRPLPSAPSIPPLDWALEGPRPSAPTPSKVQLLEGHVKGLLIQVVDLQTELDAKTREVDALRETVAGLQAALTALRRGLIGG